MTDVDKMEIGTVLRRATPVLHHKVIAVQDSQTLYILTAVTQDPEKDVNPVAFKFDSFINAMHFLSQVGDGIKNAWPEAYKQIEDQA